MSMQTFLPLSLLVPIAALVLSVAKAIHPVAKTLSREAPRPVEMKRSSDGVPRGFVSWSLDPPLSSGDSVVVKASVIAGSFFHLILDPPGFVDHGALQDPRSASNISDSVMMLVHINGHGEWIMKPPATDSKDGEFSVGIMVWSLDLQKRVQITVDGLPVLEKDIVGNIANLMLSNNLNIISVVRHGPTSEECKPEPTSERSSEPRSAKDGVKHAAPKSANDAIEHAMPWRTVVAHPIAALSGLLLLSIIAFCLLKSICTRSGLEEDAEDGDVFDHTMSEVRGNVEGFSTD